MGEPLKGTPDDLLGVHGNASTLERGTWPVGTVDFAVNTNPWGPPPSVVRAITGAEIGRYPDTQAEALTRTWEERLGRNAGEILFGAGAIELIQAAVRAFLGREERMVVLGPTFTEPERFARAVGAGVQHVNAFAPSGAGPGAPWDVAALVGEVLRKGEPSLVYLCSPNNPTGHAPSLTEVEELVRALRPRLLILDESFFTVAESGPVLDRLRARPMDRVLRVRSLTKDFAIPGVRLGYGTGAPSVLSALRDQMPPWSVSAFAAAAGFSILQAEALDFLGETSEQWQAAARASERGFRDRGFPVSAGAAPFKLVHVGDAGRWRRGLLAGGAAVRDCTSFGLPEFIRVAARPEPDRERLFAAIDSVTPHQQ